MTVCHSPPRRSRARTVTPAADLPRRPGHTAEHGVLTQDEALDPQICQYLFEQGATVFTFAWQADAIDLTPPDLR